MRCYIILSWVFSCVYTVFFLGGGLYIGPARFVWCRVVLFLCLYTFFRTIHLRRSPCYTKSKSKNLCVVLLRRASLRLQAFLFIACVASRERLLSEASPCVYLGFPPYVIRAPKSRRSAQTSRIISVFSGNFESPHPTHTHTHIDTRTHTHTKSLVEQGHQCGQNVVTYWAGVGQMLVRRWSGIGRKVVGQKLVRSWSEVGLGWSHVRFVK